VKRNEAYLAALLSGYPKDYRDPPWDGSTAQFRDIVYPARLEALQKSINGALADMGFPDLRFEWTTVSEDAP
jgi:hypothetical protein